MRALLALIFCCLAMPVLASEKLVVATCGEKGCVCALSSVTVDEAIVVLGIDPRRREPVRSSSSSTTAR